ncbi:hypothetical protein HOB94_00835 [bacterium]|jgi:hypothetical protein|nr:hypothetical protein [bacterium]MBT4632564.1 hypothetical protein [bacterium]MBT6779198.1 hypothetical protein [bacterium]
MVFVISEVLIAAITVHQRTTIPNILSISVPTTHKPHAHNCQKKLPALSILLQTVHSIFKVNFHISNHLSHIFTDDSSVEGLLAIHSHVT